MSKKVALNDFVRRQTVQSQFSHFDGDIEDVAKLAETHFGKVQAGYRDGVLLVPVPPEGFSCGVVEVNEGTELRAEFKARREGEDPYISVVAVGGGCGAWKLPAKVVEIVLYRWDVLAEGNERSTEADWEVVSINARPTEESEPMLPMTMARNFLGLPGGTKATYTPEEFARSIIYWSKRAMLG